jgi:hypothetical protein
MRLRALSGLLGLCLAVLLAGPALAVTISLQVGDSTTNVIAGLSGQTSPTEDPDVVHWYLADGQGDIAPTNPWGGQTVGVVLHEVEGLVKEDPFVTSNITLINPTPITQTYTFTVTIPITPYAYDSTIASSIGVTVTDTVGGSVTVSSTSPQGIYSGQVNGGTILTLMPHLTTVSCNTGTGCTDTDADNSALPQLAATPGVANSIGIQLKFTLTPFDQVAITSRFEIIQSEVPEPGAATLLGVGLAALAFARRRAA